MLTLEVMGVEEGCMCKHWEVCMGENCMIMFLDILGSQCEINTLPNTLPNTLAMLLQGETMLEPK
jgi:hypothetical protein